MKKIKITVIRTACKDLIEKYNANRTDYFRPIIFNL